MQTRARASRRDVVGSSQRRLAFVTLRPETSQAEQWTCLFDLLGNALVSGLLLGGFYAAVTIGVSISFGMLDIVNIAHPAFIILGSYTAYIANSVFGFDPILSSIVLLPAFYLLGVAIYHVYDVSFERRGDASIRGLAFFFGILFITEVTLVLVFGVDYRLVDAPYIGPSLHIGVIDLPLRLLVPLPGVAGADRPAAIIHVAAPLSAERFRRWRRIRWRCG